MSVLIFMFPNKARGSTFKTVSLQSHFSVKYILPLSETQKLTPNVKQQSCTEIPKTQSESLQGRKLQDKDSGLAVTHLQGCLCVFRGQTAARSTASFIILYVSSDRNLQHIFM